jgi:hypothetical protein
MIDRRPIRLGLACIQCVLELMVHKLHQTIGLRVIGMVYEMHAGSLQRRAHVSEVNWVPLSDASVSGIP